MVPDSYALASLQLLQMELSVSVQSNQEVELQASLRDMALCDEQPDQKQKKTGSVQHVHVCVECRGFESHLRQLIFLAACMFSTVDIIIRYMYKYV